MHAPGKGIAGSALPYKRTPPSWLKVSAAQVEENVCKLAKKGLTPSQVYYSTGKFDLFLH
jgi:small subunit ribosomal protein S13e